ncbi:MAG TPA: hypothetical protein VG733_00325 [Chthoniobacteraceae bacterium]|nr:hypothetical protein [Chthoniobacteraceae bacterium]
MTNVVGIFEAPAYERGKKLAERFLIQIDSWEETENAGYFSLISTFFEDFAQRDAGCSIHCINVLVVLAGNDLPVAIERTGEMLKEFGKFQKEWIQDLGTVKEPGQPERRVGVLLQKKRLLAVVRMLRMIFSTAKKNRHCVVFGNGILRRPLLGETVPEGTEIYS